MKKKLRKRKLKRMCLVCGKKIYTTVFENGRYTNSHYFGVLKLPIEGTGEYIKTGTTKFGKTKADVVKWTGKEKELEYWECDSCYEEAGHECWLEEKIEKLFGERCKDFEQGCAVCEAWSVYDAIREDT
ncbi:MAG: hypothetical protein ABH854_00930 [Candidatus Diapherotrites archaeon]|nr:hypothetical protein [Candidatus Micrarchaeota archaeon]